MHILHKDHGGFSNAWILPMMMTERAPPLRHLVLPHIVWPSLVQPTLLQSVKSQWCEGLASTAVLGVLNDTVHYNARRWRS